MKLLLSIDTSCDETSVAVTRGLTILSNVVSSQVRLHKKYGGVVPFLAQRLHEERIDSVVALALDRAGVSESEIEAIAVTYGPGLAPALQVGVAKAKQLSAEWKVPLYAVDHMIGHICSTWPASGEVVFPALAVLVSGGHTEFVLIKGFGEFSIIGRTLDDALGEAYDKAAIMLGLGYPGGKHLAKLAESGSPEHFPLPVPMQKSGDYNLSYSGLKTAVRYLLRDLQEASVVMDAEVTADIAASFEYSAQKAVELKMTKILRDMPEITTILVAGGVAANMVLRGKLRAVAKAAGVTSVYFPRSLKLCGDNAAMIGFAAHLGIEAGQKPVDLDGLDRVPYLSVEDYNL